MNAPEPRTGSGHPGAGQATRPELAAGDRPHWRGEAARLDRLPGLEATAVGSGALQRLAELAAHVLRADAAQVSLLGEVQTVAGAAGLPPGSVGSQRPLSESFCAVAARTPDRPMAIEDAATDERVAERLPARTGEIGAYLGMPLATADGHVVGVLCVFTDSPRSWSDGDVVVLRQLADSAAAELQLSSLTREFETSRVRSELAIDAAGIGSFDWDLGTGRLSWDDRLIELFGYRRGEFDETLDAFNARLHPDDRPRVAEQLQTVIDSCGELDVEYRVLLPDGRTRWLVGRGRALADDRGQAVRIIGAAYDTTDRRAVEARVARVLETMNAAFFALDTHWRFTYVNGEAERVLHRSREELLGGLIWELFPGAVGGDFERHYREAMASGREHVFEAYYPAPLDAWFEVRAWPGPDGLSVYFLDITERRAAQERARASAARLTLIAEVSAVMGAALGGGESEESALQAVARAVVPVLGDWVVLTLSEADGRMHDVASWHVDPELRQMAARYAALRLASLRPDAPVLRALASGQLFVIPDVPAAVSRMYPPGGEVSEVFEVLAPQSAVALPLTARGRTLGALSVYRSPDRPAADPDDVAATREVADRVALALDNARLYEQQRRMAEELQRSMLTAPPEPDHAEIVVRYQPAVEVAEVGGDWYDAFLQPDGATVLVIGDVVGHDSQAAAAMGQVRGLLRGIAYRDGVTPCEVLSELDRALRGLEVRAMATAAIVRIEQTDEERAAGLTRLRWSNAGHPAPLLLHADGRVEDLAQGRAELMLGVDPGAPRTDTVATCRRGATVLLYTDGLVEGRRLLLDDGTDRLRAALAELADQPLEGLCDALLTRLRPGALEDDVALVAIRLHPQDQPRPAEAGPEHAPPGVPTG